MYRVWILVFLTAFWKCIRFNWIYAWTHLNASVLSNSIWLNNYISSYLQYISIRHRQETSAEEGRLLSAVAMLFICLWIANWDIKFESHHFMAMSKKGSTSSTIICNITSRTWYSDNPLSLCSFCYETVTLQIGILDHTPSMPKKCWRIYDQLHKLQELTKDKSK